jgi:hypothetical protein
MGETARPRRLTLPWNSCAGAIPKSKSGSFGAVTCSASGTKLRKLQRSCKRKVRETSDGRSHAIYGEYLSKHAGGACFLCRTQKRSATQEPTRSLALKSNVKQMYLVFGHFCDRCESRDSRVPATNGTQLCRQRRITQHRRLQNRQGRQDTLRTRRTSRSQIAAGNAVDIFACSIALRRQSIR